MVSIFAQLLSNFLNEKRPWNLGINARSANRIVPTSQTPSPGVEELHTASKYVGDYVKDHEPDIVVLATPHGINLSESIGIYASRVATGSAEWNRTWGDFRVSANINDEFATELYNHLQVNNRTSMFVVSINSSSTYYLSTSE